MRKLYPEYAKNSYKSTIKDSIFKNWEKIWIVPSGYIQIANKYMKRCSISLVIRDLQVKTLMRYHFTSRDVNSKKHC